MDEQEAQGPTKMPRICAWPHTSSVGLPQCPRAAVTNDCRLSGLKQYEPMLLPFQFRGLAWVSPGVAGLAASGDQGEDPCPGLFQLLGPPAFLARGPFLHLHSQQRPVGCFLRCFTLTLTPLSPLSIFKDPRDDTGPSRIIQDDPLCDGQGVSNLSAPATEHSDRFCGSGCRQLWGPLFRLPQGLAPDHLGPPTGAPKVCPGAALGQPGVE